MMKRERFAALFSGLLLASWALVSCYQDIEVDTSAPGSLLPVAGVYNMRDLGGYATFDNTMYAGQKLQAYRTAATAIGTFGQVLGANSAGLASFDSAAVAAVMTAWATLKEALPSYSSILTGSTPADLAAITTTQINSAVAKSWDDLKDAFPEYATDLSTVSCTTLAEMGANQNVLAAKVGNIAANMTPKQVRRGVIIRSGDLSLLTDRDISYLADTFHIKAVIDFRGIAPQSGGRDAERAGKNLDRKIPGALMGDDADPSPLTGYPRANVTISAGLENKFGNRFAIEEGVIGSMAQYLGPDKSAVDTEKVMIAGYRNFMEQEAKLTSDTSNFGGSKPYEASGRQQMHNFFKYLIYEDGKGDSPTFRTSPEPVIFHCSAGKDRTGIAAALFYSALGVPRETIIADYMLSAQYVAEKYTPVVNGLGAQLEPLVSVRREYIESMFKYIDDTFPANRWETDTDESSTLNATATSMAPAFGGSAAAAAGYLYGTNRGTAGAKVFPNVSYDDSAAVIKFLTAPLAKADRYTYHLDGTYQFVADAIGHSGGLGLTPAEIYQLRALYLEH